MTSIEKRLSISSESLADKPAASPEFLRQYALGSELFHLLEQKNGFYAFEFALHVLPCAISRIVCPKAVSIAEFLSPFRDQWSRGKSFWWRVLRFELQRCEVNWRKCGIFRMRPPVSALPRSQQAAALR